jgi:glycosyltransferase involved in cell wall biosynthesis
MIVKDESPVIQRCLASVKHLIDYWVIVDTGSQDGTQQIIRDYLKEIPGELHERPWVDFAINRNVAMDLAKNRGDYLLIIDADEFLVFDDDFQMPELTLAAYFLQKLTDSEAFYRELLIDNRLGWRWQGALHESLWLPQVNRAEILKGIANVAVADGHRSRDPKKFLKDAAILERMVSEDPNNGRHAFYLAISYLNAKEHATALKKFEKRVAMGGDGEEVFYSMMMIARLQEELKMDPEVFIDSYHQAYQFRPTRAEPLFYMACYYGQIKADLLGYLLSKYALSLPYPSDQRNVNVAIYEYELLIKLAAFSYELGYMDEACSAYEQLIEKFERYLKQPYRFPALQKSIPDVLPGMKLFVCQNRRA